MRYRYGNLLGGNSRQPAGAIDYMYLCRQEL
jgi:hypothetical protein